MKRLFLSLLIVLSIVTSATAADYDFSNYSIDELHKMREAICTEILSKSEWAEVVVPVGYYVVGEDIPEGHWTIKYAPGEYSVVEYFQNADSSGKRPADLVYDYYYDGVCDPASDYASVYNLTEIDLVLTKGFHLTVNYGPVIFTPFTGRPSPFF